MEKIYYTITEVCKILRLKPHNIRYWETELPKFKEKTKTGYSRRYTVKDIEFLRELKELIYKRKFSLEGAAKEIKKRNKEIEPSEPIKISNFDLERLRKELLEIKELLLRR